MKRKLLTAILLVCVAIAITACGGKADTTKVEETTAIMENTETEATTMNKDAVEPEQTDDEAPVDAESIEEIESGADGTVDDQEFPIIDDYVAEQDKSDEYGVYSISCFDLDEFLDENGHIPEEWDWESNEAAYYSGRWVYPVLTPCSLFEGIAMTSRSDTEESFYTYIVESGTSIGISIYSGLNEYDLQKSYVGEKSYFDTISDMVVMFTAQTIEGESDVLYQRYESTYTVTSDTDDADGNLVDESSGETEEFTSVTNSYYYNLGNFSIAIRITGEEPLTEDQVQEIIDNIRLTNGLER